MLSNKNLRLKYRPYKVAKMMYSTRRANIKKNSTRTEKLRERGIPKEKIFVGGGWDKND